MFYVYVIYSESRDVYYKGQTNNVVDRLERHNGGYEKFTSMGAPWQLKCCIAKSTRGEAKILEGKLKRMNRAKLEAFIIKYGSSSQDVSEAKS